MNQQSMFSPILTGLAELREDEGGQVMPFTAVLSLFLLVIWLSVYNVGVGVVDKVRLQDMADQMAYTQAIVGARSMNLIALNNRTVIANLVSYTCTVIMRSHSKFLKNITTMLNLVFTIISLIPPLSWAKFIGAAFDVIGALYDMATFLLALLWRPILQVQTVFILIPATKLMFSALAALPVFNAAEFQGMAVYQELTNEELDASTGEQLWTKFGARHLGVSAFSGSISPGGGILDAIATYFQLLSWASWDHLVELPGPDDDRAAIHTAFHAIIPGSTQSTPQDNKSTFSLLSRTAAVSQQRRMQWIVEQTYPRVEGQGPERWGFNRSPLPEFFRIFFTGAYAAIANIYTLFVHGSPARVSITFGGETRVSEYRTGGRISQFGSVNHPRTDMIPFVKLGSGARESVYGSYNNKNNSEQFEIVAYDYFEVLVEYIDWDPWPSWEKEDTLSFEIGEAAFSSTFELPVFEFLEPNVIKSLGGIAIESFYESFVDDVPGFNDNRPHFWRGLFHEKNEAYDDFLTGAPIGEIGGAVGKFTGITFLPVGYLEIGQNHFADKFRNMFEQRYIYHRQDSKSGTATPTADRIEKRKGKYYVVVGKSNTQMRLLRWLGLLDGGGQYTTGGMAAGSTMFDGQTYSEGGGSMDNSPGGDSRGGYNEAATTTSTREIDPHFRIPATSEGFMVAISKSEVFYERPHVSSDPQGRRNELPNLYNAFWSARLAPIGPDVDSGITSLLGGGGIGGIVGDFFTLFLTH